MDNNHDPDWDRWRGRIEMRLDSHSETIESHGRRLDHIDGKVNEVLAKLAVPLFITSIVGVGLGGLIVALLTKSIK